MANIFQVFDLNNQAEKKVAHDSRRFSHGSGVEAPRNSLDIPLEASDSALLPGGGSLTMPEDVPIGYELHKSQLSAIATRSTATEGAMMQSMVVSQQAAFSGELESKQRRVPSIVAQLMGLDAMPDELLPLAPRKSCHELQSSYNIEARPLPFKENRPFLLRQKSQGSTAPVPPASSSLWPPPLPKKKHRRALSQDNKPEESKEAPPVEVLPFRDHPQEKQLQEFKKGFAAAQLGSHYSQGPAEWPCPAAVKQQQQLQYMKNWQLEEKKNRVRATLDAARLAMAQQNRSNPPNLQLAGEEFQESKEFLDAMEFLHCNKEFFLEFLQQKPNIVFSHQLLDPASGSCKPPAEEHLPQLKPLKKVRGQEQNNPTERAERKREAAFSPRAFARQFLESLRRHDSKLRQAKRAAGNETKIFSVGSRHELFRCSSGSSRRRIAEADLCDSNVITPTSNPSRSNIAQNAPISLKMSLNISRSLRDGRDCVKESAQQLIEEVKERAKQWDRNRARGSEVGHSTKVQGSSKDSKVIAQEIARQARGATSSSAIAKDSSRYEVSFTRSALTGKCVTICRKDMEDSNVATTTTTHNNNNREGALTPTLRLLREQISRSCISLPNSPRLPPQKHDPTVAAAKVTKTTHLVEKAKALFLDHVDAGHMHKVVSDNLVAQKVDSTVDAIKNIQESPKPGSLGHTQILQNPKAVVSSGSIVAERNALSKVCQDNETSNTDANCQDIMMKPEKGNGCSGSQKCRDDEAAKENSRRDAMPERCDSPPSASLSAHEQQGQSGDGSSKKPMNSVVGPDWKPIQKCSVKAAALLETAKSASVAAKNARVERRRDSLLVDKKIRTRNTVVDEQKSTNHHHRISPRSPTLASAQILQLVKARVLQNSGLVDEDCVDNNRGSKAKLCSLSTMEAANSAEEASTTGTPLQRDKSNSVGDATNAGASMCEQESLEDLLQMTPQAHCQQDSGGGEQAMADCGNAAMIPFTPHQVESREQSRTQRPWLMKRDVADRLVVDDGVAADLMFHKSEQPSPISVLESPFEEESPSPLEFKEITNDLQELRIRLRLSKVDGSDRSRANVENAPPERDHAIADAAFSARRVLAKVDASTPSPENLPSQESFNNRSQETTTKPNMMIDNFLPKSLSAIERVRLRKVPFSSGWEDGLTYTYNVLHSSGFVDKTGSIVSRWHSLTCPLGQCVFERLEEACYSSNSKREESSNRQMLFDAINETLLTKLGGHCNLHPWLAVKGSAPPIGKKIAEEIWVEICNQKFDLQHKDLLDDYLESLVSTDLTNSDTWLSFHQDMDCISMDLEHAIFNDLIKEVVQNLISSY